MITVQKKGMRCQLELKEESDPGCFYFEGILVSGDSRHEIYGYYHDQTRPRPHHVWIFHSPTMSSESCAYWEAQISRLIISSNATDSESPAYDQAESQDQQDS